MSNKIILYIIKNAKKELYDTYKKQCLNHYSQFISYNDEIKIKIEENGKPYIDNNPFYFNVSHSQDYYIMACFNSPIGIDIEKHKDRKYHMLAERFFTKEEIEYVKQHNKQGFFDLWCMKESYTKYLGQRIFNNLDTNMVISNQLKSSYKDCYFKKIEIDKDYSCYIASKEKAEIKEIYL